jgi:hypothetical protein
MLYNPGVLLYISDLLFKRSAVNCLWGSFSTPLIFLFRLFAGITSFKVGEDIGRIMEGGKSMPKKLLLLVLLLAFALPVHGQFFEKLNVKAAVLIDADSGRVLYNQKGTTSFPVRLISEIFLCGATILKKQEIHGPYSVYDPLCGGAYGLTILGFLHNADIKSITASDINADVIGLAGRNLSLLSEEGIGERIQQIEKNIDEYGKDSHREALLSAKRLQETVQRMPHKIQITCCQADALKPDSNPEHQKYDIVITDFPYGDIVEWVAEEGQDIILSFLDNLLPKLYKHSIVAISSDKKTAIRSNNYKRLDKFNIGKRQVTILQPL